MSAPRRISATATASSAVAVSAQASAGAAGSAADGADGAAQGDARGGAGGGAASSGGSEACASRHAAFGSAAAASVRAPLSLLQRQLASVFARLRLSLSFPSASPPMLLRHLFPASTPTLCPSFRPSAASSRIRRLSPARRRGAGAGAAVAQVAAGVGAGDVQTFILTAGALAAAAVSLRLALKVPFSAQPLRAPTPRTHSAHPLRHPFSPRCSSSGRPPPPSNGLPSSRLRFFSGFRAR
ncbi:unnamed protein product, partial [Closterium sp. NIES-65]